MIEILVMSILAGVSVLSLSYIVYQRVLLNNVSEKLLQIALDKSVLEQKFIDRVQGIDNKEIEQTQGFVKFLSESRDWAFTYIEDVQQSIQLLKDAIENGYPTEEEMKKLFDFLPENNKENNE